MLRDADLQKRLEVETKSKQSASDVAKAFVNRGARAAGDQITENMVRGALYIHERICGDPAVLEVLDGFEKEYKTASSS